MSDARHTNIVCSIDMHEPNLDRCIVDIMERYKKSSLPPPSAIDDELNSVSRGDAGEVNGDVGGYIGDKSQSGRVDDDVDVEGEASADESEGEDYGGRDRKRRRGMPRREDFGDNFLAYVEAKYAAGVSYDSDDSSGSNRGSVYSETGSLVDDTELIAQLEDDVIGGVGCEEGEGEGFFASNNVVNVQGEDELQKNLTERDNLEPAPKQRKRVPNKTEEEYEAELQAATAALDEARKECKRYARMFEEDRRMQNTEIKKYTIKIPPGFSKRIVRFDAALGKDGKGTATVPAGMSGKTMVATVEYPVEGWLKDDDKVNVPNTDEGGELIQKVLDAYNKKVTAESQYNLKVIKKKCAGDYTEYDVKGMKAKKYEWFLEWANGVEKDWDGIRKRWMNRKRQREKKKQESTGDKLPKTNPTPTQEL